MKFQALLLSFVLMTYSPAVIGQENQCIASIKKNCLYKDVKDFFAATRISPDLREIDPHTYKQISTSSELLKQNKGHKTVYYSLADSRVKKEEFTTWLFNNLEITAVSIFY